MNEKDALAAVKDHGLNLQRKKFNYNNGKH